mmetsp:Transcript_41444/g.98208  ORF Transcript_41444/g.98208 Transcript_41444/m.98208 type:complete len:535 (+) Transcript_41444:206-1810(+)
MALRPPPLPHCGEPRERARSHGGRLALLVPVDDRLRRLQVAGESVPHELRVAEQLIEIARVVPHEGRLVDAADLAAALQRREPLVHGGGLGEGEEALRPPELPLGVEPKEEDAGEGDQQQGGLEGGLDELQVADHEGEEDRQAGEDLVRHVAPNRPAGLEPRVVDVDPVVSADRAAGEEEEKRGHGHQRVLHREHEAKEQRQRVGGDLVSVARDDLSRGLVPSLGGPRPLALEVVDEEHHRVDEVEEAADGKALRQDEGDKEERLTGRRRPEHLKDRRRAVHQRVEEGEVDDDPRDEGPDEEDDHLEVEVHHDGVALDAALRDGAAPAAHGLEQRGHKHEHDGEPERREHEHEQPVDPRLRVDHPEEGAVHQQVLRQDGLERRHRHDVEDARQKERRGDDDGAEAPLPQAEAHVLPDDVLWLGRRLQLPRGCVVVVRGRPGDGGRRERPEGDKRRRLSEHLGVEAALLEALLEVLKPHRVEPQRVHEQRPRPKVLLPPRAEHRAKHPHLLDGDALLPIADGRAVAVDQLRGDSL